MTSTLLAPPAGPTTQGPRAGGEPHGVRYARQAARRRLASDLLFVAGWLVIAVPVALWVASGGLATFATFAGVLKGIGILTGLVATSAMVLMLWLSSRAPFIDRTIGHDKALELHGKLGQWVFGGLVAHGLFLVTAYALADGLGLVAEFASLLGVGDFVLAIVAIVLLTAVAVSSVVAVKKNLPHEVWHGIHLVTYAAVLASLPHQYSLSGLFATGAPFWFWTGLFAATFFALLTWRVFLPLMVSLEHRLVVSRIVHETPDVVTIEMTGRHLERLGTRAGQFFHWRFLAPGLWWHQHPFSVSAAPAPDTLRVTVRALGAGTRQLVERLTPGTRVGIEGPYGLFSDAARTAPDVVLVGIGIGIAPIRALLEETEFAPGHGTVILRSSDAEEVFLGHEVVELCRARGARLAILTGHRGANRDGSPSWLPATHSGLRLGDFADLRDADVFVCGPQAATDLVVADAVAAGVPAERLHHERFAW